MQNNYRNICKIARRTAGMTQERFAEALDISVESVRQYESDKIMPSDDVVTRMVEISGQPVIGYWHLLNKSRVAADILPDVQECSLEQAVIKLLCRIRQFAENNNTNRLMDISEDGIIDETERPDFDRIIKELDGIVKAAMGVFESIAGKPLTFLQWMAVGLPTAIVATLVCWICLVKIFKPEAINEECSASIREEAENAGKISAYEKKVLFMLVAMPVLWILGTWFPALDVTVVSIIGFVVMFMPGINILTWKQFEESVPWNIILMFGAILSLGTIVAKTGGAAYLSKLFLASGVMNLNIILVFFIVGVFAYLLQTFFPVAPAIISLFVPAVAAVCVPMGISAAVPTLIITIVAAGTYLLPINPISALSFDYGYYSSADMAKAGLVPSVALCAFVAVWTPLIIRILGV